MLSLRVVRLVKPILTELLALLPLCVARRVTMLLVVPQVEAALRLIVPAKLSLLEEAEEHLLVLAVVLAVVAAPPVPMEQDVLVGRAEGGRRVAVAVVMVAVVMVQMRRVPLQAAP